MRDVISRMVKVWKLANAMDEHLLKLGYECSPYTEIAGQVADAIYNLLGENTERFDQSFTYATLNNENITTEDCIDMIFKEYGSRELSIAYIKV